MPEVRGPVMQERSQGCNPFLFITTNTLLLIGPCLVPMQALISGQAHDKGANNGDIFLVQQRLQLPVNPLLQAA